tara:strand:+ start:1204 stop:2691 length:1488 start_codon:yes stop_codon:yes gene_type:complete
MPKHNQFIKKLKGQFVSINNILESYFNNLKFFIINIKKRKLSQNNKAFLIAGLLVILIISYYLIPTLYNKDLLQLEIKNQIYKKYNIEIKFNEKIKYGLLPKPHFISKNLSILRDNKEIGISKNFKTLVKVGNFFSFNEIQFKDLIFDKTDFNIYQEDLVFFEALLKIEPSENKVIIKNSNIFFKNNDDDILFINKIKKSQFYYDSFNLENVFKSKNEIFNTPYKLVIKNNKFNKRLSSEFNSKKIRLNIQNKINYDSNTRQGLMEILFVNKTTALKYDLKDRSLDFFTEGKKNKYKGLIEYKPFYLKADFNYDGLSTKNLFNDNSILYNLVKSEILNNENLNININLNVRDIVNIDELNNLFLNLSIESGDIKFSDSNVMWKDDLKIYLSESLLNYDQDEIYLTGKIIVNVMDTEDFYRSFQIKKIYRKKIKEIEFDFNYNFTDQKISFNNFEIDNKPSLNVENFVEEFNLNKKILNKITFKNFVNDFFKVYFG